MLNLLNFRGDKMKIMAAEHATIDKIETFLDTTHEINKEGLLHDGYVVEIDEKIKGCFVLSIIEDDVYWLKQLYIAEEAAAHLHVLLESILQMSKGKQAKKLYEIGRASCRERVKISVGDAAVQEKKVTIIYSAEVMMESVRYER